MVLSDAVGSGPMVTTQELERVRRQNFGIRALSEKLDAETLLQQIDRYDATDAAEVSRMVRESSDLGSLVDGAVNLYCEVIEQSRGQTRQPMDENRAVADYLRWLTLTMRSKQSEYETMFASSLTLRLRNGIGRVPFANKLLRPLAARARRGNSRTK